jgi:hypothetical protein
MNKDYKDILSNLNKDIEQEKLLEYLNRKLTQEEQHDLEKQLNDDAFMSDAMDGLQELKQQADVQLIVDKLNHGLKKQLDSNKKNRAKRIIKNEAWIYYTVVLLLLLASIAFIVIRMFINKV